MSIKSDGITHFGTQVIIISQVVVFYFNQSV